jgi:outer membrane usher protein
MRTWGGTVSLIALSAGIWGAADAAAATVGRQAVAASEAARTAELNRASLTSMLNLEPALPAPPPPPPEAPTTPPTAQTPEPAAPAERQNINPYDRDINLTVPLQFNRRVLGELPVLLTRDDRFIVDSSGFIALINPLLTDEAKVELEASLTGIESFEPEAINTAGIQLDYDPEQLAVMVLRIDPTKRVPQSLFRGGEPDPEEQGPEAFSAYLNTNLSIQRRESTGDVDLPSVFLNGAINYRGVVFEADVQGREDQFTDEYEVERRYARLVYDQPEEFRRWFLGDLSPETRGRQGFVELGGVGVARQKRRFEAFRNNVLTGARQIVLQENSVVRVLRNGVFVREFRLDPGQYDVSNLPLTTGSNDVQLEIEGVSGRRESVAYNAYLDTIDLEPGDYEYAAYFGIVGAGGFGSPDYSTGELAFTGYYRKAFLDRPAIGVGLQASEDVQNVTAQTQYIIGNGSRLRLDGAVSNSRFVDGGYALGVSYDYILDFGGSADVWTVAADYTSENYTELGRAFGGNPVEWSFSAGYSKRFSPDWSANINGTYQMSRDPLRDDSYGFNLTSSYRFAREWTIQAGLEYVEYGLNSNLPFGGIGGDGFGFTAALVWTPRYDRRAEARYSSARESASVRFQQSPENRVDSFGYSLAATDDPGSKTVSGQVDYISNRFDASLSHFAFGESFSNITDEQVTAFRIGTSFATTGGKVAMGRNIFDSFAIVYPHESLGERDVIAGETLEGGRFTSRSGAFGPALDNTLTSYVNQSVRYDAIDAPLGYDIGDGVVRVRPGYRSGYAIEVGSGQFVSALGRLVGNGGRPVALMSGNIRPVDDPTAEPELFFTNSVGRFAIQKLEPGKRYRVNLFSRPALNFEFTVPADNEGLLDLQVLTVPLDVPE